MKKFLIVLFILLIAGGAAFFFGWAQFSVPADAYGVLSSKTHGVDPRPVRAGEFRWLWYKLIPANVSVGIFRVEPVRRTVSARGALPSGDVYAAFAGVRADFSWEFDASFSFALSPAALPSLVAESGLAAQDDLTAYQQNLADSVESFLTRTLAAEESAGDLETLMTGFAEKMEKAVPERFPVIRDFSCSVKNIRFPDFALYAQVRGLYEDYLTARRNYESESITREAESRANSRARFEELEQYGELLTKYPILLEYLTRKNDQAEQ